MYLSTYKIGIQAQAGVIVQNNFYSFESLGLHFRDMNHYILEHTSQDHNRIMQGSFNGGVNIQEENILAPIMHPMQDIICLGINYLDHAKESAKFKKEVFDSKREYAVYFSKRVNEATGAYAPVPAHEDITQQLDYEVELAVILGKDLYKAKEQEALESILGYTIINEMSARDLQVRHKQWYFGKSLEGCCVMGPYIVHASVFDYKIPQLQIQSRVNGEIRQNGMTDQMIFDPLHVLMELSSGMLLKAGTIISMGTPKGVGMGFEPPKFLKVGDVVECYIEKIGKLKNKIISA